jgi:hypothetical protein
LNNPVDAHEMLLDNLLTKSKAGKSVDPLDLVLEIPDTHDFDVASIVRGKGTAHVAHFLDNDILATALVDTPFLHMNASRFALSHPSCLCPVSCVVHCSIFSNFELLKRTDALLLLFQVQFSLRIHALLLLFVVQFSLRIVVMASLHSVHSSTPNQSQWKTHFCCICVLLD